MTMPAVQPRILQALGDYLKRDPMTIPLDAVLRDDLGLDSMATIELLYRVEETFDLQIPDQDLPGLRSVRDVVTYVERRLAPATSVAPPPAPRAKSATRVKDTTKKAKPVKKSRG